MVNWNNSFLPKISNLLLAYSWLLWAVKKATSPEADLRSMQYEDYDAFFEARENNAVYAFLGLTAPPGSKEAEAQAKQQA